MSERLVVGCMSGTSCDGIDVALVDVAGQRPRFIAGASSDLGELGSALLRFSRGEPLSARAIAELAKRLGATHVACIRQLPVAPCLIAVHGQTVYHAPPLSWQLCDLAGIAAAMNCDVIADLRSADLAQGGQGAPITPLFDHAFYASPDEHRIIVNLGGFCNATALPAGGDGATVRGADICVCNQLLDELARRLLMAPVDRDGACAASGRIRPELAEALRERLLVAANRSLGSGDENLSTLYADRQDAPANILATTIQVLAEAIVAGCRRLLPVAQCQLILAGGGIHNHSLYRAIVTQAHAHGWRTALSDDYGLPAAYREAAAMAVLGALAWDGTPITLPAVTGVARAPIAGCRYPAPFRGEPIRD